jgi:hypothetical protein
MVRASDIRRVACGLVVMTSAGCAAPSSAQSGVIEADSDVCAVLTAFVAEVAPGYSRQTYSYFVTAEDGTQTPADFSGMPDAVVWPEMGATTPSLLDVPPDATEEVRRQIAEFNAKEASLSIEVRVERERAAVRGRFEHLRDVPAFDDELGESYVRSYGPAQRLACTWPRGVEQLAENEDPGSYTGSRWRRVIETYSENIDFEADPTTAPPSRVRSRIVHEPTQFSFSGVGISPDGRRALLHYSSWTLNGHWGWGRGPEELVFGGYGDAGFVVLEWIDDGWLIAGYGDTAHYN